MWGNLLRNAGRSRCNRCPGQSTSNSEENCSSSNLNLSREERLVQMQMRQFADLEQRLAKRQEKLERKLARQEERRMKRRQKQQEEQERRRELGRK